MRRYYLAAAALVALFVAAGSIERADSLPLFQHTAQGGLSDAHCLSGDAWAVTLTLTGTNPELHPTADITYTGNAMRGAPVPYQHVFTTTEPQFTASAHIVWTDGFTQDVGPWTATKPDGCGVLTQQTEPPTTTCAAAIPPRTDCGGTTSTTPSTTSTPSSSIPTATSVATPVTGPVISPTTSAASSTKLSQPTGPTGTLPTTGSSSNAILAAALGLITVGSILAATRRGRRA